VKLKSSKGLSIIDKDLKIEGSILSIGQLIIKGQVTGTIEGDVVIISAEGRVTSAYTKVSSITIGGNFQGEIVASDELIILSTGTCAGKVEYKKLIVENGGVLNAEVICKKDNKLSNENKSFTENKPLSENKPLDNKPLTDKTIRPSDPQTSIKPIK
jgi:cytoskeletal protein CcmA (bactofilin family)